MSKENIEIITPPGRIVWGDVHKAQGKTDSKGQPKMGKDGKQLFMFDFGVAIPKSAGRWQDEPGWGVTIATAAAKFYPGGQTQWPTFAFKVTDGDSVVPNRKGIAPNTREGYPGHWVLAFSGMFAPSLFDATQGAPVATTRTDIMLPGDLVQIMGSVSSNESTDSPGVYLNHNAVCYRGMSAQGRITPRQAVDASKFGSGLAAGATTMPAALPGTPGAAPAPAPAMPPAPAPSPATPPQVPVVPSTTFVPGVPAAPVDPMVKAAAAGWLVHPQSAAHMYKGEEVLPLDQVRARFA